MEKLINFDECKPLDKIKAYGGVSGNKEPILFEGEEWFLKYPRNLLRLNRKNQLLPYSNTPLSEYMGSRIYEILGLNVHKTVLGISKKANHIVVACRDFLNTGDRLYEYREIKVTGKPFEEENEGSSSSGNGSNLDEVVSSFRSNKILSGFKPDIERHFWDMFVIDALIGNGDRNNGNWGIIVRLDGKSEIAPVYDNGGSFYPNMGYENMEDCLRDEKEFINRAYRGTQCVFTYTAENQEEKFLNMYKVISSGKYEGLNESVLNLVPVIQENIDRICDFIWNIPDSFEDVRIISPLQKIFYKGLVERRFNNVLLPFYEKLKEEEKNINAGKNLLNSKGKGKER